MVPLLLLLLLTSPLCGWPGVARGGQRAPAPALLNTPHVNGLLAPLGVVMFPPEEPGGADHAQAGVLPRQSSLPPRLPRSAVPSTGGMWGRKHAVGGANTPCSWGSVNRRPWGPASLCRPFANASAQEGLFSDLSAKESRSSDSKKVPCGLTSTQCPAATGPSGSLPAKRGSR